MLGELASEAGVSQSIRDMFSGQVVNPTEGR